MNYLISNLFVLLKGIWEPLNFPNPPSSRYGMASASSLGSGLYIFGGFGMQGSTPYYNPYMAYGSGGLPSYKQNPIGTSKQNPEVSAKKESGISSKQGYNMMNPTGYNNYNDNDDRIDENYYPLGDTWYLSYL